MLIFINFIIHLKFLTILVAAVQRGVAYINNINNYKKQVNQVTECLEKRHKIHLKRSVQFE